MLNTSLTGRGESSADFSFSGTVYLTSTTESQYDYSLSADVTLTERGVDCENITYSTDELTVSGSLLSYVNNRALIFEGGNEYHRFDISSVYTGALRVESMDYDGGHYDAYLYKDAVQPHRTYVTEPDVNGRYVINLQEAHFDLDTDADYINVHFAVPRAEPFFDGQLYIGGECCYNLLDEGSRMRYDFNAGEYFKTLLLKQGGYNYQYWFVPKGETRASVERVDGSFWEARNEYTIYVYHRPWGGRYDLLVGVETVEN